MSTDRPEHPRTALSGESEISRRALLAAGLGAAGAGLAGAAAWAYPLLTRQLRERPAVFVGKHAKYDGGLVGVIRDGLELCGVGPEQFRGSRVLLKPNMVEPIRTSPHMTTHPAMLMAAAEVFRGWGATVVAGEGPGHVRDTELALVESRLDEAIATAGIEFADLNYQEVGRVDNRARVSRLRELYFPRAVLEADFVVSMPKLKTHHWIGFTAAMKNLYGVMPGIKYGWPKNVLHHAGIPQSVIDINAALPRRLAIVDAIECMEGDGPIMGSSKHLGLVVVGNNPTAVDATCARIMGLDPERIPLMQIANRVLGPISDAQITQRGEAWRPLVQPFQVLDFPFLQEMRARRGVLTSGLPAGFAPARYACGKLRGPASA